jgi:diguanylate cyclase (GGDEF)-like protein
MAESLGPIDACQAVWSVLALIAVGVPLSAAAALAGDVPGHLDEVVGWAFPATFTVLGIVIAICRERLPGLFYFSLPILGAAGLALLAITTEDRSAAGQLIFLLPLVFAASQLRPLGAMVSIAVALPCDAAVVFTLSPPWEAARDLACGCLGFAALGAVVIRAGILQRRLAETLRSQAAIDSLTGLVTRRVLDEAGHSALAGSAGRVGTALILVDLDKFKQINDQYGHPVGDAALVHVAAVLSANVRAESVVSRLGGDELAVLLPGCDYSTAVKCARRLVEAVRSSRLVLPDGTELSMSISAGAAHAPQHASELSGLYAAADGALYEAKRQGRDRVGELDANETASATRESVSDPTDVAGAPPTAGRR